MIVIMAIPIITLKTADATINGLQAPESES